MCRDVPAVRGGAGSARRGARGGGRGATHRHALRPRPQNALVQDVGRLGRAPRAVLRMYARLPDRDAGAPGRSHPPSQDLHMTRALTRAQLGVTDAMIASYGETIFKLSNNHQIRRGDPIRLRDFTAIEAPRNSIRLSIDQSV